MQAALNPAQRDVLRELRGDAGERPSFDPGLRDELQQELENSLRDVEGPLSIDKSMLDKVHQCEGRFVAVDDFAWTPANAKGTIAHKAIELSAGGVRSVTPAELVRMATERIFDAADRQSLAEYIRHADDGERAEIRVGAIDMVIKFFEMFPPMSDRWRVNAEAQTAGYVGHRRVVFRGKIDLRLGELTAERSNTLIIDLKTGNPSFSDLEDLRFYALLETLRTGVPPFRWANVYLSAGRAEWEDAGEQVLWSAARRLIDGTRKIAALKDGTEPRLSPGNACRFCPAAAECGPGTAFMLQTQP